MTGKNIYSNIASERANCSAERHFRQLQVISGYLGAELMTEHAESPKCFTAEEVADLLRIDKRVLFRSLREGRLKDIPEPIRLGDRILRWRVPSLLAWLEGQPAAAESSPS